MGNSPTKRTRRSKIQVKEDIIEAVGTVLAKYGFSKLGITLVAQEANVDKTVIYRNFEDFEKLLEVYVDRQDYWLRALKEYGKVKIEDHRGFLKKLFVDQFQFIYSNTELQQLLIWELGDHSEMTKSIPMRRESMSQGLLKQYNEYFRDTGIDFNSFSALIIAGIYFSILHKDKSTFCNTNITKKADREQYVEAIKWIVDLVFDAAERRNEIIEVAKKCLQEGLSIDAVARVTGLDIDVLKEMAITD